MTFNADNTYDIGASGATRPRSLYIGTNITAGGTITAGSGPTTITTAAGLLIGGVMAAPFAAFAAKHFSPKLMLILVGSALTVTSGYGVWTAWG